MEYNKNYLKKDIDFIIKDNLIYLKEKYFFGLLTKEKLLNGTVSTNYKDGKIKTEKTFWNGIGITMKIYFNSGQIKEETIFDTPSKRHGEFKKWYKNGQLECKGNLEGYYKSNEWLYWYENGKLMRKEKWTRNVKGIVGEGKYISRPFIIDSVKCWDKNDNLIDCSHIRLIETSTRIYL
tara:strand:+ start:203 stop:739 length:537 start_codon:yes stop_codon:yes gene_type:complete